MSPIPWEVAWHRALYTRPGRGSRVGLYHRDPPARHFATSGQGVPGAGRILADALASWARAEGATEFVDFAAGRGELATSVAERHPDLRVHAVDVVARPAALPDAVEWHRIAGGAPIGAGLPAWPRALVFAQEWLDVIPCPVWQIDAAGGPRVVLVDERGDEVLGPGVGERGGPTAAQLDWCATWWPLDGLPPGARVEVGLPRDLAWAGLVGRARGGVVVAVDYGHFRAGRPPCGTLAGFRQGRAVTPLPDGSTDVTAHVALDAVAAVPPGGTVTTQREALIGLGVRAAPPDPGLADRRPAAYVEALQRAGAAGRLLDPAGLGGFGWVIARP